MPSKADTAVARTIGIDTGKNTLHMIGLDERGAIVLREKILTRDVMRRHASFDADEARRQIHLSGPDCRAICDGQGARNAPCNGPNTDARDQLSPDHYIRLAPHGRSIQKYMVKRCGPPSQGWRTFLRNHAPDIGAMDLFVVPTIGFDLLYALVVVRLARRDLVWINVTSHPTAEWIARQITEAFPWDEAPRYLIRDRDQVYGAAATRRLRTMGIRDKPIAPGSPWQTDEIDKRFLGCRLLCCRGARATAWRRAGFEVRALPRSHDCRSSFAALVRTLGPLRFQPETNRS
jgi:hypothetical protein